MPNLSEPVESRLAGFNGVIEVLMRMLEEEYGPLDLWAVGDDSQPLPHPWPNLSDPNGTHELESRNA